jgi:glycosyltransferase involved in cell wall biosynthesis
VKRVTKGSAAAPSAVSKRRSQAVKAEPRISVILPVYEEKDTLGSLIPAIIRQLGEEGLSFEIVAVDDGSSDGTAEVLDELRSLNPAHLRVIRHVYNKGYGAALRTGIRVARGEIVVCMDADGQHSPEKIPLLASMIPPYDLVIGARLEDYKGSWHRGAANRFYNALASWLSRTSVKDLNSGFRAMRRAVVLHFLPLFPAGFSASSTTTLAFLKAGYNVAFVPVHVKQRQAGKSKISLFSDGSRFVTLILRMVMLYDPLRIFLSTGVLLALIGILAWVAGVLNAGRLLLPNSAILLFTGAIMTWLLGLIADQISGSRIQYQGDEYVVMLDEEPEASRADHDLPPK